MTERRINRPAAGTNGQLTYDIFRGRATRRGDYLRQNVGVNNTSTLKISRRPRIIASVHTQV